MVQYHRGNATARASLRTRGTDRRDAVLPRVDVRPDMDDEAMSLVATDWWPGRDEDPGQHSLWPIDV